jgi:UDPglucose--hexose-1-phosphate uridylyltransferase
VFAPQRAKRPGAKRGQVELPTQAELDECPFCEGREDRTPPESLAIAPPGRKPDTPGWQVRVVPNLYPAFEHQEVVIHSPRHVRSLAELEEAELAPVAAAWSSRLESARAEGFDWVQLAINEGQGAGASLPHGHSQLVWLREPPPAVADELPQLEREGCALCALLRDEELEIALHGGLSLLASPTGRMPYELLIAPREHEQQPDEASLTGSVTLLRAAIRRLHQLEGPVALNAWLHAGGHWHFELLPRQTVLAGLELGAGVYVNWLPPEEAAIRLRVATAPSSPATSRPSSRPSR